MEYIGFCIQNFKGISQQEIILAKQPAGGVFALVGLNESGKTTVLEAISYLEREEKLLESVYVEEFRHGDVHDLIPMKKKANFNGPIKITATISLSDSDKTYIVQYARKHFSFRINQNDLTDSFQITREMQFKNSVYEGTMNMWTLSLPGKPPRGRKNKQLIAHNQEMWNKLIVRIRSRIPSILYFPTFLFEFPQRIYVSQEEDETLTNAYYRSIIQDILDSIGNELDIDQHIVNRARSESRSEKRSLDAVLNKMGIAVSQTVFVMWNEIFDKKIQKKDIVIECHTEDTRVYLEFFIKDGSAVYLITERSLGFRWFFCFLLFTHFRRFRKGRKSTLFLFDEPASNLHSRAQTQLLSSFSKLVDGERGKIIYSTHSHHMINPKWLENAYIVSNEGMNDTDESEHEYSSRDTDIQISRYREFVSRYPGRQNYFQPILDVLDYAPSALESISDAIFVEGKTDFYMIKYFDAVVLQNEELLPMIPGTGAGTLDTLISLYLGWGKNFIILLDDDEEGKKCQERYIHEWNLPKSGVLTLRDISEEWARFEMEKLLCDSDINSIKTEFYSGRMGNKISKKDIARAFQEKLIRENADGISSEAKSNFGKLIHALRMKLNEGSK